jgi:hypothetical protein
MKLSEHFTTEEACLSSTALRSGIDNTPNDEQLDNMKVAASGIEAVRALLGFPLHVDSWLRVEDLEKILTKKDFVSWCQRHAEEVDDTSWRAYFQHKAHPKGFAVDFICPDFGTPLDIVHAIQKSGIKFDQLIQEGAWVHVSFAPEMRMQVLTANFTNGTPSYSQGA